MAMTVEDHQKIHKALHTCLDELVADFINHTKNLLSKTSIMELVQWSYQQTIEPTEEEEK
jgi:hypothetical protein